MHLISFHAVLEFFVSYPEFSSAMLLEQQIHVLLLQEQLSPSRPRAAAAAVQEAKWSIYY